MKVIIIADDITGAIDTGVQFARLGIHTGYYFSIEQLEIHLKSNENEIYIINAETRHMHPDEAYHRIYDYVRVVKKYNPDVIIKKTDSALRGNPGAELAAVMDVYEREKIDFIPAYPEMKRYIINGICYINDEKVSESVFGKDPFEPVTESEVKKICSYRQHNICVHDAKSNEDIRKAAVTIMNKAEKPALLGGCAGLGKIIAELPLFENKAKRELEQADKLVVICGSVNEISMRQVEYARKKGYSHYTIKFDMEARIADTDGQFAEITNLINQGNTVIDTGFSVNAGYADDEPDNKKSYSKKISNEVGELINRLVRNSENTIFMIIGGDTLQGFTEAAGTEELELYDEVPAGGGAVWCNIKAKKLQCSIITKSGGFGKESIITDIEKLAIRR